MSEETIFKGIKINYPKSMLLGNVKCWGNNNNYYSYAKSIIKNAQLFPLLSMPIETEPNLRIFEYWLGKSFLNWNLSKKYITEKDILDLVSIDNKTPAKRQQTFKNARIQRGLVGWQTVAFDNPPNWPLNEKILVEDKIVKKVLTYYVGAQSYTAWMSSVSDNEFSDVTLEFSEAPVNGDLQDVLKNFLTYRYNYDRKFPGAEYDEKGNPINDSAKLRQKFEGQKPEDVIDGIFEEWKFNNPTYLLDPAVEKFKQIIYMLSNWTYSKLAVNKGYNDDIKILSPYYFDLISKPVEKESGYWEYTDCIVKLNSLYFDFSDGNNIKLINKDISTNEIYKLEANYYNWLSITNELESNKIPSLIPGELKLNDGEYGKYLTNLVIKDKIEDCLNIFSTLDKNLFSKFDLVNVIGKFNEELEIDFITELTELNNIEISGIWGYGKYSITLIIKEKEEIIINDLLLFDKHNEKLSLISLEI
ncbi:hypothetical protein [Spiroplasma sp. SV19]|uniref:hypothetical protein n=1 Tax=Spiroplasma sp. SV19 TaxID=2570468 RepID=UPI0024B639B5|nr:hypothetical protein [Spiroplasma sp. SV19]WHQ36768.1 hypothetical protein E7Y35_02530 [Spiroplasma sp. SV19]